jgi:hypothetical protein
VPRSAANTASANTASTNTAKSVMSRFRDFRNSTTGAVALTASQMFLGAVSIGIGMFRGTEVYTAFHHETLVAHASYGASKLASDHARSANVVVNDNVIMSAIMGPRFGVEADNITMDANAEIACPTCPKSSICKVCMQYKANKPRAAAKLAWVRAKQKVVWGVLGKLSGDIDKLASMQASNLVKGEVSGTDSQVSMSFDDPSQSGDLWGGGNADVGCKLAMKDTLPSPVTGHAFPLLISPNLLEGLPKSMVQAMPQMICQVTGAMQGAMGGGGGGGGKDDRPQFPEIKSISDKTRDDCRDLEEQMRCAVSAAKGQAGACSDFSAPEIADLSQGRGQLQLSGQVQPYVKCQAATLDAPLGDVSAGGYWYRNNSKQIVTCSFDREKCQDKQLTENTDNYMRDKLGLPKIISSISSLAASLGGSETRKPSQGGSNPKNFCACSGAKKPVNDTVIGISDAVRKIASFGEAQESQALRKQREYKSCGRWYFPDRKGEFASTPQDEQPFVGAWKWSQVTQCQQ